MQDKFGMDEAQREALLAPIGDDASFELYVRYMDYHDPERVEDVSLKDARGFDVGLMDPETLEFRAVPYMEDFETCLEAVEMLLGAHGDRVRIEREKLPSEVNDHIQALSPAPQP